MDIHIITKKDFSEHGGNGQTRWWKINDNTINAAVDAGGSVYLHSRSKEPAFIGGRILEYRRRTSDNRIEIDFERDDDVHRMAWPEGRNVHGNPVTIVRD